MICKKKLVIVSAYFPPYNHIASRRIYAFANYLSDFYEVTVITSSESKSYAKKNDKFSVVYLDNGLLGNYTKININDVKFIRFLKILFRKFLMVFNISFYFSWRQKTKAELGSYLKSNKVDYILSSYMPIDAHEACYEVLTSSNIYDDIFWIADMRDEMSEHYSLNKSQKKDLRKNELKYSSRANLVTSVSLPILNQYKNNMPYTQDFLEIRNGYDHNVVARYEYTDKLRIGYFGSFYGEIKPNIFFDALSKVDFIQDVEVIIASKIHNYTTPKAIEKSVKKIDFLPYEESISMMGNMDCNLLILPYKENRQGVYSGKLFDYLSVGRPILGLINKSDVAADLIRDFQCDYIVDPANVEEIYNMLVKVHNDWREKKLKVANKDKIQQLHRKSQVNLLISFLQEKKMDNAK